MAEKKKSGALRRQVFLAIAVIILAAILLVNVFLMRSIAADQTEVLGRISVQNVHSGYQRTLLQAQSMLDRVCDDLEELLAQDPTGEDVRLFLSAQKARERLSSDGACLNIFCVFSDTVIISDEDTPDDYVLQDRVWYRGLLAHRDEDCYISPVYADPLAGNRLCFTVARFLPDGHTAVGVHYSASAMQARIREIGDDAYAVIVDGSQTIAACSDATLVGKNLSSALPQYLSAYLKAAAADTEPLTLQSAISGRDTYFSMQTAEGWSVICHVENNAIRIGYGKLMRNCLLLMVVLIIAGLGYILLRWGREPKDDVRKRHPIIAKILAILDKPLRLFGTRRAPAEQEDGTYEKVDQEVVNRRKPRRDRQQPPKRSQRSSDENDMEEITAAKQRKYRIGITVIFGATMLIAIVVSSAMTVRESRVRIQMEMQGFRNNITGWIREQRDILDMFDHVITAQPEMLEDYDGTVSFLDSVVQNYPRISSAYIANPAFTHGHSIVMSNGWVPEPDYRVETRPWYTNAIAAARQAGSVSSSRLANYAISDPYNDLRTGEYCVTFSKAVLSPSGELYGVFGIDFFLDALEGILTNSVSRDSYAFLVDKNGRLIDHPNTGYNGVVSISELPYYRLSGMTTIRDYDGSRKVCASSTEAMSGLRLFLVKDWMSVYGGIFAYAALYVVLFGVCIFAIHLIIHKLLKWQRRTNDSLKAVAESAIRAEKAKMQFLSNISHELRTPINAVLGMNEMILRECRDENLRSYAMNIHSSGKTLLFLINDILDMSKIESGKMKIVPVQYEPGELVVDLWNVIYLRAQEKGLSISFTMDENVPRILFGDDVRIKQIVTNILTNAVKYTHKGSVEMRVSFSNIGFKMIGLVISVKDSGIGIKKEDMSRLFESFQRLEEEKNRNIEGAGLGMSITMSLLKQMGGEMRVESEYQKGSTFTVTIPQRVIDGDPTGDFETVRNRHNQAQDQGGSLKTFQAPDAHVLVVDDNDMNRAVFKALLNRTKIRVDAAESGMRCLELAREKPYHIIFMDHMMPEMDGIETLEALKKLPADSPNAQTPVIALTANALAGAKDEYLKKGFADFLSKPIDGEMLERMIVKHLPEELVKPVEEAAPAAQEEQPVESGYAEYGISLEQGLHYSAGNMDVYLDLTAMFLKDTERPQLLAQYLAEKNMKDYSILVHALKGNARTLGAQKLADIAFEHEQASRAGDQEAVESRWEDLTAVWQQTKEGLTALYREHRGQDSLPELDAPTDTPDDPQPTGDLLELTPEALASVAAMIDNFESEQAVAQLKEWLRSPLEKSVRDRVKKALTTLEDEFDEGRAMKLLNGD